MSSKFGVASRQRRSGRRKWIYLLATVVVIGLAILIFQLTNNAGNKGSITAAKAKDTTQAKTSFKLFSGRYVKFEYSSRYAPQTLPAKDLDLELYMFTADTIYDKRLAVSVSQLPEGQLTQSSAYMLRSTDTAAYSLTNQKVDGLNSVIATKSDGSEKTAFIPNGQKIAILSFVTANTSDDINNELQRALSTFQWVQQP